MGALVYSTVMAGVGSASTVPVTTVIARKAEPATNRRRHGALVEFFAFYKVVDGDGAHDVFLYIFGCVGCVPYVKYNRMIRANS